MKKRILLGSVGAVLLLNMLAPSAKAQTFIASFGVEQHWRVPFVVSQYIDDFYYGYNWVHTRRISRYGSIDYEVVLQRGNVFIEVSIDTFGRVYKTISRDFYPLHQHVCNNFCGYHANYYQAHYTACTSHSHHNHNHVTYYTKPYGNAYGYYQNNTHYNDGHSHHKGGQKYSHNYDRKEGHSKEYSNSYPQRRGTYHSDDRKGREDSKSRESNYTGRNTRSSSSTRYASR